MDTLLPFHGVMGYVSFFYLKTTFFEKKSFKNTLGVSHSLEADQARHSVEPRLLASYGYKRF